MRIAVFLPNWIGDAVMATPAIEALQVRYPTASMVAVGRPYVRPVVDGSPWFEDYLDLERGAIAGFKAARRLRHWRADTAILFPNSFRVAAVAALAGCRNRIGFVRYGRGPLLTHKFHAKRGPDGKYLPSPVIDDYNLLAEAAGASPLHRMRQFTTGKDEIAADEACKELGLDPGERLIGLNPGAAFGASKFWPVEHFAELARKLVRDGSKVLVFCGPKERDIARSIVAASGESAVSSLADMPLSLGLTKALVRRLSLLVTTDSGPRHFAAAFDVPVVSLFGPTHIEWTETYFDKAIHLQRKVPCGPCQLRTCPTDHRCMKELTPAEVHQAVRRLTTGGLRHAG